MTALALVWLFVVFPFEFSYSADVLPSFLQFLLQWVSNDVAKAIMAIGIVAVPAVTVYIAALYVSVR